MFSGIVKGVGRILALQDLGGDQRWVVGVGDAAVGTIAIGGSIAVSGACLTVTESHADRFAADLSTETLRVTTLGGLGIGARVNLEPPLRLADPLDGHLVTGHVDGVGKVLELTPAARSTVDPHRGPGSFEPLHSAEGLGRRGRREPHGQRGAGTHLRGQRDPAHASRNGDRRVSAWARC